MFSRLCRARLVIIPRQTSELDHPYARGLLRMTVAVHIERRYVYARESTV